MWLRLPRYHQSPDINLPFRVLPPYFRRGTWSVTPDRFTYNLSKYNLGTRLWHFHYVALATCQRCQSYSFSHSIQPSVKTVCIAIPWNFAQWSKTRPLHQLLRPPIAGNEVCNSSYKPSFHLVSLIQVTPSSLLLSLIYPRGLCFKIKSNFTRAVERPSVCAIASIRLHSGLGTSTGSAEPVAALGWATIAAQPPLRLLTFRLCLGTLYSLSAKSK